MSKIRVEIDHGKFWKLGNPVHFHVYVGDTLRKAGIPVEGGLEMQGVARGRLTMWNETRKGKRICVYEWEPIEGEDDEEL